MRLIYIDENTDFDALFGRTTESSESAEAKDSSTEPTEAKDSSTQPAEWADVHHLLCALFGENQ